MLSHIAKSQAERSKLLKQYFEPNEEEREQGIKVPTAAHRAIAQLIESGHIRVVITTNFDKLLEMALIDVGVVPTVISTTDAIKGAFPLTHNNCTIIKVHGDYLDTRIKNTTSELEKYDKPLNQLLDRIFDEYGLVVCGWSAEWDAALKAALERCRSHRFTTYWTDIMEPTEITQRLIVLRRAMFISIENADSFFQELSEKIASLEDVKKPHPLSVKIAVATLKRYLSEDRHSIRLHDLVIQETETLYQKLSDDNFPVDIQFSLEELVKRVQRYEALTEMVLGLVINGCFSGREEHERIWIHSLERIEETARAKTGINHWLNLRLYPALLLLYGGGISSIASEKYSTIAALLMKARGNISGRYYPMVLAVNTDSVMEKELGRKLPGMDQSRVPMSSYLCYKVLREPFRELIPSDDKYNKCFDRFEYLLALIHADLFEKHLNGFAWPLGLFCFLRRFRPEPHIIEQIESEASSAGENWPPLRAGLFDGSLERLQIVKGDIDEHIKKHGWF